MQVRKTAAVIIALLGGVTLFSAGTAFATPLSPATGGKTLATQIEGTSFVVEARSRGRRVGAAVAAGVAGAIIGGIIASHADPYPYPVYGPYPYYYLPPLSTLSAR